MPSLHDNSNSLDKDTEISNSARTGDKLSGEFKKRFGKMWRFTKRFFGSSDHLRGRDGKKFIETLQSRYLDIKGRICTTEPAKLDIIYKAIDAILLKYDEHYYDWDESQVWSDAFKAERLMGALYTDDDVLFELQRRVAQSSERKQPFAPFYEERVIDRDPQSQNLDDKSADLNRKLLVRLIDDMQWQTTQIHMKNRYASAAQKRVSWTFILESDSKLMHGVPTGV